MGSAHCLACRSECSGCKGDGGAALGLCWVCKEEVPENRLYYRTCPDCLEDVLSDEWLMREYLKDAGLAARFYTKLAFGVASGTKSLGEAARAVFDTLAEKERVSALRAFIRKTDLTHYLDYCHRE